MIRLIASARVAGLFRIPRTALVTVFDPGLRTPRMVMQRCSHSTTTITPLRLQVLDQGVGDLAGEAFLDLGSLGEDVDQSRELGQPGDLAVGGDVGDVGDPGERQQVVLAGAPHLDVTHQHHLVVAEVEGRGQHLAGVLLQTGEHLAVGPGHPAGGVTQAVAVGILPDPDQDLADRCCHPLLVDRHGSALLAGVLAGLVLAR